MIESEDDKVIESVDEKEIESVDEKEICVEFYRCSAPKSHLERH